jgi:hypothetical protein
LQNYISVWALENVGSVESAMMAGDHWDSPLTDEKQRNERVRIGIISTDQGLHGFRVQDVAPCIPNFEAAGDAWREILETSDMGKYAELLDPFQLCSQRLPARQKIGAFGCAATSPTDA